MQEFPILDSLKRYSSGADLSPLADNSTQSTAFLSLLEHQSSLTDATREIPVPAIQPQTTSVQMGEEMYDKAHTVEEQVRSAVTVVERTASESGRRVVKAADRVAPQVDAQARSAIQETKRAETERSRPVTAEDLRKMIPGLRQWGLSDKDIQALKNSVNGEEGLTWGQLVTTLTQKMSAMHATVEFSATDKQQLMGFFQKAGFNPEEASGLIGELAKGNQSKVLEAVMDRLKLQPAGKTPDISPEEAGTFLKALRLPDDKVASLKSMLTGAASPESLKNALAALGGDVQDAKDNQLRTLVQSTFQQSKTADAKFDADKVMEKATEFSPDTNKPTVDVLARQKADSHHDPRKQDDDGDASAWREFFQKLRDESPEGGKTAKTTTLEGARDAFAAGLRSQSPSRSAAPQATVRQVLSQVRDGVVRNMADGTKQLRINLHPEDLGTLHLTLQVRDGEVKALIRADNHDTAKMLSEQLDSLRRTLQEQGLKVTKVEVQTGLSGEGQMNWQGAENHNDAQQREAADQLMWRRRMAGGGGGDVLAQDVLSTGTEANLAGTGLHLIA